MPRPEQYFTNDETADRKAPRPELFDSEAQEEAKLWSGLKPSQIRRFFGQVMADRRRFELREWKVPDAEPQVAMALLKAGAAYAAARDGKRKPLADFAAHHARLVRNVTDFRAFARHFEAVVAWHKAFEKMSDGAGDRIRGRD
ncbi:type III-A CRISPR-associated protein Csm2 [Tabrizicola sp. YIM 78059]|uniref:type III-A CRISPR-associated protein Csm2 n=1 Tax=Tabrizicola sp. YIM 78059 TaxID=2529861 RepID=UPI0010AA484E|nr:type III-A CRISPR-associated protein Csm2 [Tabrizicola sp. YIM 78059]